MWWKLCSCELISLIAAGSWAAAALMSKPVAKAIFWLLLTHLRPVHLDISARQRSWRARYGDTRLKQVFFLFKPKFPSVLKRLLTIALQRLLTTSFSKNMKNIWEENIYANFGINGIGRFKENTLVMSFEIIGPSSGAKKPQGSFYIIFLHLIFDFCVQFLASFFRKERFFQISPKFCFVRLRRALFFNFLIQFFDFP